MRNVFTVLGLLLLSFVMLAGFMGCAGSKDMMIADPGYMPTHVAIGEIMAYTAGVSTIQYDDLIRMTKQQIAKSMRSEGVKFIREREMDKMESVAEKTVLLDMEMTFQSGMRSMTGGDSYNVQVTYKLRRRSDGLIWKTGSAKSTDEAVSQSAGLDLQKAVAYAAKSVTKKVKALMKGE